MFQEPKDWWQKENEYFKMKVIINIEWFKYFTNFIK